MEVEELMRSRRGLKYAVCLAGTNACPPEDCGGSPGYDHLLAVLADPTHQDPEHLAQWAGDAFDPSAFDLGATNTALQSVRSR
jgi:hypothetical protein